MQRKLSLSQRLRGILAKYPYTIGVGSVGFTLIMLGLAAFVLMQGRQDAIARAVDNAENLALVVERDVTHTFQLLDLSLQAVADGVQDRGVMQMPPQYRQQILFDRSAVAGQYTGVLLYVDAQGNIAIDSGGVVPRKMNFADRDWFQVQRDHPNVGLYISSPQRLRLRNTQGISLSRRVNNPDGSFAGVVVGSISLDYFRNLLADLRLGANGSITLIRPDGTPIMRYPYRETLVGRSLKRMPNFEHYVRTKEPWFFGRSTNDNEQKLYVFRQFARVPMLISIAPASSDIFASWSKRAWYIGTLSLLLALWLLATAWLLTQEFVHRLQIEANLRLLANTDRLTGLNNRRRLEETLAQEGLRTQRSGKPLSLVFIDIDRFKDYNDTYGHQSGDNVLVGVAQAIGGSIKRPGDIAARFGGEEFIVVLPETGLNGARRVAASIQQAVWDLQIEHTASEHHYVTVSVGIACKEANDTFSLEELMKLADGALYHAKTAGRNQICVADTGKSPMISGVGSQ